MVYSRNTKNIIEFNRLVNSKICHIKLIDWIPIIYSTCILYNFYFPQKIYFIFKFKIQMIIQQHSSSITNKTDESIEQSNLNPSESVVHDISNLNSQNNINQRLVDLLKQSLKSVRQQKLQQATQSLQKVQRIMEYMTKINKPFDKKIKIVCYYNLACIFQGQWILDKCSSYLAKCLQNMEIVCTSQNNSSIKRSTLLVQTVLQYCAILSQYGDHNRALETAKLGIPLLKQIFQKSLAQCHSLLNSAKSDNKIQKIPFSNYVIQNAVQMLTEINNIPSFNEIKDKQYQQFSSTRQKIYFWKNNPQNNQKLLRKQLGTPSTKPQDNQRSLLGVQSTENWIQTYNIGTIMHMKHLVFQQYIEQDNFIYQMSKRRLLQKIILISVSYFSLATQLRFIEIQKAKQDVIGIKQKYIKTDEYKTSEIFHLKSIQIICRFVRQNSVFINHLISSYHKHYRQNLLIIEEEASIIEYSMIYEKDIIKKNQKILENENNESMMQITQMSKNNLKNNNTSVTGKVMGYQPLKKRDMKNPIFNATLKKPNANTSSSVENIQMYKSLKVFDKNPKEQSIRNKNMSSTRVKDKSESKGKGKGYYTMRQESFNSKNKSKSISSAKNQKKLSMQTDKKSKKSLKSDRSSKKILIEGENEQFKITQNLLKNTVSQTGNKNLEFLRKINKVNTGNTINTSTTKKNFSKKQKTITSPDQITEILQNLNNQSRK